jgi:SAM-dependent methyltransferase
MADSAPPADGGSGLVEHWFEPLAAHLGSAYLRYSFTKGTVQEVDALCAITGMTAGRVLDVGCGPGRHSLEFARRGFEVVGVDISAPFIDLATEAAAEVGLDHCRFVRGDARRLLDVDGVDARSFDLVLSLCQGAFGLTGGPAGGDISVASRELDEPILSAMAKATRPHGRIVVSAFSSYFQIRHTDTVHPDAPATDTAAPDWTAPGGVPPERFDAASGVNHEWTSILDAAGNAVPAELWTTCYTPRELRLLARVVGLEALAVYGVTPGRYGRTEPSIDCPEFLLVARPSTGGRDPGAERDLVRDAGSAAAPR